MNVIFLDIDGVLNSRDFFRSLPRIQSGTLGKESDIDDHIDSNAVARLNKVVDATCAKIVISSTWRLFKTVDQLQALLDAKGFTGIVIGKTCELSCRSKEIQDWLQQHHFDVNNFIILDDDRVGGFDDNEINTTFQHGLEDKHVVKAIAILTLVRC